MNVFLISDTHFSHKNICSFTKNDGSKLRPFDNVEEMDELMIENWNKTVRPIDKVYHLGDVAINRNGLKVLERLNGKKVLIKGNHDIFPLKDYLSHFYDIRAYHILDKMILSHIPIHPNSNGRFKVNIHGHTHSNKVMRKLPSHWCEAIEEIDPFYFCVCVEQINYTPISLEEVKIKYI
jgi:calcineurin-like phosphoesterase family protein